MILAEHACPADHCIRVCLLYQIWEHIEYLQDPKHAKMHMYKLAARQTDDQNWQVSKPRLTAMADKELQQEPGLGSCCWNNFEIPGAVEQLWPLVYCLVWATLLIECGCTQGKATNGVKQYVEKKGLAQISDPQAIGEMLDSIISAHPDELQQFRSGKTKVQGYFSG